MFQVHLREQSRLLAALSGCALQHRGPIMKNFSAFVAEIPSRCYAIILDAICFYKLHSSVFCSYPVFSDCSEMEKIITHLDVSGWVKADPSRTH